jgi:hypothetical protein
MQTENTIDATVSLDEIVTGYLDQYHRPDRDYRIIHGIAVRGLRLFYRDSTGQPQTVNLTVLANKTAVLPIGALNRLSCGVLNNRGEIAPFTFDPSMSLFDSTNPQRTAQPSADLLINNEQFLVAGTELNNGYLPGYGYEQLGVGSQPNLGFYNIDWANRVVVFDFGPICYPTVQFVYMGLPCCDNGDYFVHPFFQEALISWIDWQVSKPKRLARKGKSPEELDFDISYRNARMAMDPFSMSDAYNQYRSSLRMAVKV